MANTPYFSPLPDFIGRPVTEAVSQFAEKMGLRAEMWVHDLPLWFVTLVDRDAGVVRRLQIAAYTVEMSDELRMIPQVFRFKGEDRTLLAFEETSPELIRKLPLWEEARDGSRGLKALEEAWQATLRLMPPPNSSSKAVVSVEVSPDFRL